MISQNLQLYYYQYKSTMFWFVVVIHSIALLAMVCTPWIVSNPTYTKIFLVLYLLVIVQWFVLGHCILSRFENKLNPILVPNVNKCFSVSNLDEFLGGYERGHLLFFMIYIFSICILFKKSYYYK